MAAQNIQFLDGNLLLSRVAMIAETTPPISTLFGNLPGGNTKAISRNVENFEGLSAREGVAEGSGSIFRVDLGASSLISNIVMIFNGLPPERSVEFVAVPVSALDQSTDYLGLQTFKGWRAGNEVFYLHLNPAHQSQFWHLIFIGSPLTLTDGFMGGAVNVNSAISAGLSHQTVDPSQITYADSGRAYAVRRSTYQRVGSLTLPFLNRSQVQEFKRFSDRMGLTEPFWVAIDPENFWDGPAFGASFGAYRFGTMPAFSHNFKANFSASFELREVL